MKSAEIVNSESLEFFWCIPENSLLKAELDLKFTSKSGVFYTGKVNYKLIDEKSYAPQLQLTKQNSRYGDLTHVNWIMQFRETENGEWFEYSDGKISTVLTDSQNVVLTSLTYDLANPDSPQWWKVLLKLDEISINRTQAELANEVLNNWGQCLDDSTFTDLIIQCSDGAELPVHKLVLSVQNQVFADDIHALERNPTLIVNDICISTMKIIVHFLYTGELLDEWKNPEQIVEFTHAAGKYGMTKIMQVLDAELGIVDHGDNTMKLLALASKLSLQNAENRLIEQVKKIVQNTQGGINLIKLFEKADTYLL